MNKLEFTKEFIEGLQSNFSEEEKPTIEQVMITLRTSDYINNHLDYFKTDQYYMIDVSAEIASFIHELFNEIREYKELNNE